MPPQSGRLEGEYAIAEVLDLFLYPDFRDPDAMRLAHSIGLLDQVHNEHFDHASVRLGAREIIKFQFEYIIFSSLSSLFRHNIDPKEQLCLDCFNTFVERLTTFAVQGDNLSRLPLPAFSSDIATPPTIRPTPYVETHLESNKLNTAQPVLLSF